VVVKLMNSSSEGISSLRIEWGGGWVG